MIEPYERDLLSDLLGAGVGFVIVGGLAMNLHGVDRKRGDLDLLVQDTAANKEAFLDAIAHRWALKAHKRADFLLPLGMWRQDPRGPFRGFDFTSGMAGIDTSEAVRTAVVIDVEGLPLPVMSIPLMIANKNAIGEAVTEKDHADLAALLALQG